LLGDNPMQSELACHIGSMGKFFCRICKAKGFDAAEKPPIQAEQRAASQEAPNRATTPAFAVNSGEESDAGNEPGPGSDAGEPGKGRKKKVAETMADMVAQVTRFV
jgi:hypothetical protein